MHLRHCLCLILLCGATITRAAPMVMLVDASAVMPEAAIEAGTVRQGLHLDIGQALAKRLGRELQLRVVPRKRIAQELERGVAADLICDYQPEWLPGPFAWSRAFIPNQLVLITRASDAAPARLEQLRDVRLGTVLGFSYPELDAALGRGFLRDDALDSKTNLRKFEVGRVKHALVGYRLLAYQQRKAQFTIAIHAPLVVAPVLGRCGLSPRSPVNLEQLNEAILGMEKAGELGRILDRYR